MRTVLSVLFTSLEHPLRRCERRRRKGDAQEKVLMRFSSTSKGERRSPLLLINDEEVAPPAQRRADALSGPRWMIVTDLAPHLRLADLTTRFFVVEALDENVGRQGAPARAALAQPFAFCKDESADARALDGALLLLPHLRVDPS